MNAHWLHAFQSWIWIIGLPALLLGGLSYYFLSMPVRRRERASLFLDLLELGLKNGQSAEATVVAISNSRDASVGSRFHLLAFYVEQGLSLAAALQRVPHFLPRQLVELFAAAEQTGDFQRVLPAARMVLHDAFSGVRAAVNYQILLLLVLNPVAAVLVPVMVNKVAPVLVAIQSGFGTGPSLLLDRLSTVGSILLGFQLFSFGALSLGAIAYVGGRRLSSWVGSAIYPFLDWWRYCIPWHRRRLQGQFAAVLAVLLDGEVAEERAVSLAARCTCNWPFILGAERACRRLAQGESLNEALQEVDASDEFHWRMTNATRAQQGFLTALKGWQENLEARAFQEEQAAAQAISTGLLLINGVLVALILGGLMQALGSITSPPV